MKFHWIQVGNRYINLHNVVDITDHDDELVVSLVGGGDWIFTKAHTPREFSDLKTFLKKNYLEAWVITREEDVE